MNSRIIYIFLASLFCCCFCRAASDSRRLTEKGLEYIESDNFPMAMQYFTRSLKLAEKEGDIHTQIVSTGYIGNIYFNLYDYTRSIQYLLKGYNLAVRHKAVRLQCNFLTNIVGAYCKTGDVGNAWKYYILLERARPEGDSIVFRYYVLYNRARIATAEGKFREALVRHERTLQWAQDHRMQQKYILFQYCEMGELYLQLGDYQKAISYGQRCVAPAKETNERDLLTSVYKLLADAYALDGQKKEEYEYRRQYLALSDSLFNRKNIFSADKDLVEYEAMQNEAQINSLHGVISQQTIALIVFAVIVITLIVLSLMLYRFNRKLNMAHYVLISKNRELLKAENEKEKMLAQLLNAGRNEEAPAKNTIGLNKEQTNALLNRIMKVMTDPAVISDPDFSLNALAEAVGSNTKYVSWIINDTYGKNFKTLLNEHRIREACKLLADKEHYRNRTMQAVYEDVGYTNAVSFIRAFKRINGMTPSEYQKILEEDNNNNQ